MRPDLVLQGENLLAIGSDELVLPIVRVDMSLVGDDNGAGGVWRCNVSTIKDDMLYCDVPELDSGSKYNVVVSYGERLRENVGTVSMLASNALTQLQIIAIAVGSGSFLIIVIIIIVVLKCRLSKTDQGMKKLQDKMDTLEMTVAKECKEGECWGCLLLRDSLGRGGCACV